MTFFATLCTVALFALAGAPAPDRFVVHEWGTFTHLSGSDGRLLEGVDAEEEPLPPFVHTYAELKGQTTYRLGKGGLRASRVSQKMETPVIYFYSDWPRKVTVDVDYMSGVIGEFFPQVTEHEVHGTSPEDGAPIDMWQVRSSHARWLLDIVPAAAGALALPNVASGEPWQFAREVDAAFVRDRRTGEAERYVFYRGLGAWPTPLGVRATDGAARVVNAGYHDVAFALALEVGPKGSRFRELGRLPGGEERGFDVTGEAFSPTVEVAERLRRRLVAVLVAEGLYEKEAVAMVRTWTRSWLTTPGRRILYVVPRAVVEQGLRLRLDPAPDELVRVMVGRLDYLTPGDERALVGYVRGLYDGDREVARARAGIEAMMGRFLEPAARRVLALAEDAEVKRNAERLIAELTGREASAASR